MRLSAAYADLQIELIWASEETLSDIIKPRFRAFWEKGMSEDPMGIEDGFMCLLKELDEQTHKVRFCHADKYAVTVIEAW